MAGGNEAFRICSSVSEALSFMPFSLQYTEPNTKNDLWVFWSQHNYEFPTVFPSIAYTTIYHDTVKEKITSALQNACISDNFRCWLVQFWAPITTNDQIFLTTCDLPFGLTKLHEGLCFYRSECLKFRIPIVTDCSENEHRLGPTGRVFQHGLPEMSPDVSHYSANDYPQHGLAATAGLGNYLAVPVFEPLSNQCIGVLEIIGDKKGSFSQDFVQMVYEMLNKADLRSSNMYGHPDKKGFRGIEHALKEIEEQLSFICRTHQLPLAQTWLPILDGSNVERFTTTEEQFCICTSAGYEFRAACDMFHLGKSQGVVSKAFLTRSSCYCSDITQLSMTEYPLAHVAHRVGLHSSFAICLQSSYTGDYVYLLEFFLPQDNKSDCRSPQTILNMLLASMKRQFRSFKLASGRKLGEKLSVEIIPVPSDDGLNSFEICHCVKPLSDIEAVARPGKIEWFDPLNRLLKSGNTVNICPENIDLTTSSRTANTTTKLTNVRVLTNRVVSNSSEEESMMKISEGHHIINSVVLQQSVGAKVNGTETTLASQSAPNSLGTKHLEINRINCSSDQHQSCRDTTTSLTHAAKPTTQAAGVQNESINPRKRPNFLLSGVRADELERLAMVSQLYDREELQSESDSKRLKATGSNENHESGGDGEGNSGKSADQPAKSAEPPKDYIHVRARRGHATDSHSLAERASRENISEKMQILQDLVPCCNKVIGKALVLDEIINYVQSLQRQVEYLLMKLGVVNTRVPSHIEGFPTKDSESDSKRLKATGSNENHESGGDGEGNSGKSADQPAKSAEPPKDYIHVRARRGQATDSHSLAERASRENISERMQILQDLVPGCNKVIGKALVLDEIINYVQSLQSQVEFLSMKLEAVNTRIPLLHIEGFPTKDLGQQAFEANAMAFGSQGTREITRLVAYADCWWI